MNDAVEALIRRLERSLSLTYDPAGSGARPCRAGELFRVRLGNRHFALKLYKQGYFNDAHLFRALATTPVPVPAIHACDDSRELVGKPWILMDWVEGDRQSNDRRAVRQQVGRMLREIHAIPVDGAGAGRTAGSLGTGIRWLKSRHTGIGRRSLALWIAKRTKPSTSVTVSTWAARPL